MRWEYMIEANLFNHLDLDRLNKQGEEGWELCAVIPADGSTQFIFKRQKPLHL